MLHTFAARRPWLLLGIGALTGGLLGLLTGAGPRRQLRRTLVLLVGPALSGALWGALRAESQRLVQQLIRSRLFAGGGRPSA
ncbi:MAG: hypothetical protein JNN03_16800 [Rubrivivax sp.]|nr:hypothetical protein [Rubrivivax sp.]